MGMAIAAKIGEGELVQYHLGKGKGFIQIPTALSEQTKKELKYSGKE